VEQIHPLVEQHAEMVRGERAEHGKRRVKRGADEHKGNGIARVEEADIGADQPPDEIDRGQDRIDTEAEGKMLGIITSESLRVIASGERIDLLFSDVIMSENGRLNIGAPRTRPIARASHHPHHGVYDQIESVIAMGVIPLLKPFTREQLEAVFAEQLSALPPLQPALHKPYSTI